MTSGCAGSLDGCAAACEVDITSVNSSPCPMTTFWRLTPSVSRSCAGASKVDSGRFTPPTTGATAPSVCVVSAKKTIDTNVSTSGTRFRLISRNLLNCAARRASRIAFPRLVAAISLPSRGHGHALRPAGAVGQRDVHEVRGAEPRQHLDDVVVEHLVVRHDGDVLVRRVLLADLRHQRLQLVERFRPGAADLAREALPSFVVRP